MSKIRSNKNIWSPEEDQQLVQLVEQYGAECWTRIAAELGGGKRSKQCRERYHNHLQADIKKGGWTREEERLIFQLQAEYGNQWAKIAAHFPGRTDNSIKNRYNSMMRSMQHKQMKMSKQETHRDAMTNVCAVPSFSPSIISSHTDSTRSDSSSSAVLYSVSAVEQPKRHPLVPKLALGMAKAHDLSQAPSTGSLTIAVSSSRSSSSSSIKLSPYNFDSSRSLLDMAQFILDGDLLETVRSTSSFDILRAILDDSEVESSDDEPEDDLDLLYDESASIVPFSARDFDLDSDEIDEAANWDYASMAGSLEIAPFSSRVNEQPAGASYYDDQFGTASASQQEEVILSPWWEERDVLFDLDSVMKRIEISPRESTLTPRMTPRSPYMLQMKRQRGTTC